MELGLLLEQIHYCLDLDSAKQTVMDSSGRGLHGGNSVLRIECDDEAVEVERVHRSIEGVLLFFDVVGTAREVDFETSA